VSIPVDGGDRVSDSGMMASRRERKKGRVLKRKGEEKEGLTFLVREQNQSTKHNSMHVRSSDKRKGEGEGRKKLKKNYFIFE